MFYIFFAIPVLSFFITLAIVMVMNSFQEKGPSGYKLPENPDDIFALENTIFDSCQCYNFGDELWKPLVGFSTRFCSKMCPLEIKQTEVQQEPRHTTLKSSNDTNSSFFSEIFGDSTPNEEDKEIKDNAENMENTEYASWEDEILEKAEWSFVPTDESSDEPLNVAPWGIDQSDEQPIQIDVLQCIICNPKVWIFIIAVSIYTIMSCAYKRSRAGSDLQIAQPHAVFQAHMAARGNIPDHLSPGRRSHMPPNNIARLSNNSYFLRTPDQSSCEDASEEGSVPQFE